jgi:hypothetical protein
MRTIRQTERQTDGQRETTEMTKLITAFRNFVYQPDNEIQYPKLKDKLTLAPKIN